MNVIWDLRGQVSRSVIGDEYLVISAVNEERLIAKPRGVNDLVGRAPSLCAGAIGSNFSNVIWGYEPRR